MAVQIENTDAIAEIDEIIAVPGIDSIVLGPYDLSASMGNVGELAGDGLLDTIKMVVDKAHDAGLWVGFGEGAVAESARRWVDLGADWIQPGGDVGYMLHFARQIYAEIRGTDSMTR